MDSRRRPLVLTGILIAVLAFGALKSRYQQPLLEADQDRQNAEADLEEARQQDTELTMARGRLDEARFVSLPPSMNDAQRLYLAWITDLAHACDLSRLTVTPNRRERRGERYQLVSVSVEGEGNLTRLTRFLHLFRQADLLHRITQLDLESTGTSGDPRLEFTLIAEGMCVPGSPDRRDLAPRSTLQAELTADATQLTVAEPGEFPTRLPFLVSVGAELIRVTEQDKSQWTIERAQQGSQAATHPVNATIVGFPIAPNEKDRTLSDYDSFVAESVFVKPEEPREYHPELAGLDDQTLAPGEELKLTARIDDYNPDVGALEFSLTQVPENAEVQLDAATGQLQWAIPADLTPGEYALTVQARQQNHPELNLTQSVTVTVRIPNATPTIEEPETQTAWIGRTFRLPLTATDDGPSDQLSWSLEEESPPAGLSLDADSGELVWNIPASQSPGQQSFTVKVADQGDPPATAEQSITISVKQDDAAWTRLTAIVRTGDQREAWLINTSNNERMVHVVGDRLQVADIDAEITDIQARVMTLQDDAGTWLLGLDNLVRQRVKQEEPATAE